MFLFPPPVLRYMYTIVQLENKSGEKVSKMCTYKDSSYGYVYHRTINIRIKQLNRWIDINTSSAHTCTLLKQTVDFHTAKGGKYFAEIKY